MKVRLGLGKSIINLVKLLRGKPQVPAFLADNELLKIIYKRRSIRSFTSKQIPENVFAAILEAGRLAPSTVNLQSWSFGIFDSDLWQQTFGHSIPFRGNRAVIIISDTYRYRQVLEDFPYCPLTEYTTAVMNASLAAMNMNIAAEALGISSVMLSETGRSGILDARYLKDVLKLPDGTIPLMTIVFGYARGLYPIMPPKMPIAHISFTQQYGSPNLSITQSWYEQMIAGYNISHPGSSFEAQLNTYQSKICEAEKGLNEMVFYKKNQ
ncbi:MAG: hypothetical protein CVU93_00540 [Firmicutes bacterium HGW-Firmicutes-18]|nr:MAG: hypothetical protein CVU93_00540 [Firmicutes bacterium HGW-Firmicutes-18]